MARKNNTRQGQARVKGQARQASKQGSARGSAPYQPRGHHEHRPLNLGLYDDRSLSALLRIGQELGSDVSGLAATAATLRMRNKRQRNRNSR